MIFQNLLLIFLLGGALLGGLAAYRRPWLERLILFATIPLAWLIAMLVLKGGAADDVGHLVVELLRQRDPAVAQLLMDAPAVATGVAAMGNSLVRVLAMGLVFMVCLVLLRIVYAIVKGILGLKKKKLFQPGEKTDFIKNFGAAAIGFVGAFAICMLMLMPIHFLTDLLTPTLETFEDDRYDGTYMAAQADSVGTALLPLAPNTPCGTLQTVTGLRAVMDGTANQLCTFTYENQNGQALKFNARATLRTLIKDGALGLTLYEYICNPQKHTVGDFSLAADVIEDLSKEEFLIAMAQEVVVNVKLQEEPQPVSEQETEDQGSSAKELMASLAQAYKTAEPAALQSDIRAIAQLLRVITTDLGDTPLNQVEPQQLLFDYLADEEATYRVISALSQIHVYGQVLTTLTEFGMDMLGDVLNISNDRAEHHEKFLLELQQVLGDRSVGSFDMEAVQSFIAYAAQHGMAAAQEAFPEAAYVSYTRYMTRAEKLQTVLETYTEKSGSDFCFAGDRVYVYDKQGNTWSALTDEGVSLRGCYLVQRLLQTADAVLADENAVMDTQQILDAVQSFVQEMSDVDSFYNDNSLTMAAAILDENAQGFAPEAIYRQDLTESIRQDVTFDEAQNRQFAIVVTTAADLFAQLTSGGDASLAAIMDYFPQVGRLLDGFTRFEMTSQVSGLLLQALMQSSEFGAFFSADSVKSLVENVQNGTTTYEQLFRTVQSLYNILNQLAPLG